MNKNTNKNCNIRKLKSDLGDYIKIVLEDNYEKI